MKYLVFFVILGLVSINLASKAWTQEMQMHNEKMQMHHEAMQMKQETTSQANEGEVEDVGNKICPIMGQPVDKNISYVYEGKRYYFCCSACVDTFKADPEKYIKKLKMQENIKKEDTDKMNSSEQEKPMNMEMKNK